MQPGWFEKETTDVSEYNALELRVRGDGRRFFVNLQCSNMTRTVDVWQYFLFTRGGPEWENIRVINKQLQISLFSMAIYV